ncbi:MAG: helix-turn-helix domain-containing protein [Bacteroidota bacterium]
MTDYIRLYRIIDFQFPGLADIPPKLYSPRPEQCLQFYPKDTETVTYAGSNSIISNKKVTITGQHTVVNNRQVGKEFLSIQVVFQPGALYNITGVNMQELVNVYLDAEDLFGSQVRMVNEQLAYAVSYAEMITIVEHFLSELISHNKKERGRIDTAGKLMLLQEVNFSLDKFIKESCLCHRQFDRTFKEASGIPPKQFLKIIRFDKAFRMKNKYPKMDWLSVAIHCGYYDYQHLVKDYKEFTGFTPPQFFAIDNQAPERTFGEAEI